MATKTVNLTKKMLQNYPPPSSGRDYLKDTKVPGLLVDITPHGAQTFYVRRKFKGRPIRIRIGSFPVEVASPETARTKALEIIGQMAAGINPNDARKQAKSEWSLSTLFDDYLEKHAKKHKRTWKNDQWQFDKYLTKYKNWKLSEISKDHVHRLHHSIGQNHGAVTANRVLALIRKMFNYAIDVKGITSISNPAHKIPLHSEEERERRLKTPEMENFLDAVTKTRGTFPHTADYVMCILLTGARPGAVKRMKWPDIDLTDQIWIIPKGDCKNKKPVTVPLLPEVIEILKRQPKIEGSDYVFASPLNSEGYIKSHKRGWQKIKEYAKIDDITLHDLRRTYASFMSDVGVSLPILRSALGHASFQMTHVYSRPDLEPIREAMQRVVSAIMINGQNDNDKDEDAKDDRSD